jgi:hypothetical protein
MGHANRPGQHHLIGLDTQPRRLCLSFGWSLHANANTDLIADGNTNRDCNSNSQCNGDSYSNSNIDAKGNAHTTIAADSQTSPNTATSPIGHGSQSLLTVHRRPGDERRAGTPHLFSEGVNESPWRRFHLASESLP